MRTFIRWLRGLGPVGSAAADVVTFLSTNWVPVMGTIVAIGASLNEWATNVVHSPVVQTFFEAFLATLWTLVGILYLYDRTKPRSVKVAADYRYGLTFEGIAPNIDPGNDDLWIGFLIQLRNFSQAPIKYTVDQFDFRIGSRALPKPSKVLDGYLPRGGGKAICPSRFSKDDVREFFGRRVTGTAEFSITYGHPEEPPLRRLKLSFAVTLHIAADGNITQESPLGFGADILSETDESIEKSP